MAKIISVVGGRPQFIKEAVVGVELRKKHEEILVHTGQHYDYELSGKIFEELGLIRPQYNLNVGSGSHASQTAAIMIAFEEVLLKERPDIVLVYGDMNTTVGATLTASKLNIPVAHIEAGARLGVFDMPEEQNRIVTDHLSKWNFVSNEEDMSFLIKENLQSRSYLVGDVMYDAFLKFKPIADQMGADRHWDATAMIFEDRVNPRPEKWYFATVHRPENTDDISKLKSILDAFNQFPEPVVLAVHPRIAGKVKELEAETRRDNMIYIKPVGYLDSLFFMSNSIGTVTDSGGLHRECYWAKVPGSVILRSNSDTNMTAGNCLQYVGPNEQEILDSVLNRRIDVSKYNMLPYGNGLASIRISEILAGERV